MKNRIEYIVFLAFQGLVSILGIHLSRRIAKPIAFLFFYFIPIRKDVLFNNLKTAFPNKAAQEIRQIAFRVYYNFLVTLFEILFIPKLSKNDIINMLDQSEDYKLIEAYDRNRGLILLSGHFGNWEYIALSTAAATNLPYSVVVKDQRNNFVSDWMNKNRTKFNNKVVNLGISIKTIYKELLDKRVVALVADQRGDRDGLRVNFFGKQTSLNKGPAILALKTGAPLVYGLTIRQDDFSYKTIVEEISQDNLPSDFDEAVKELTQRHTAFLEKAITEHPDHWLWMHNIWKY